MSPDLELPVPAYILTGAPGSGKTATAARRITFEQSLVFEQLHEQAYRDLGFQLVDVPAGPLADRVAADPADRQATAAVTATVAYRMVKLPPIASIAAP